MNSNFEFILGMYSIIAGLGGRWIGSFAAKLITTSALFVGAALSWPIFLGFVAGDYSGGWVEPAGSPSGSMIGPCSRRPTSS